jgi:hypothetical protein
MFLNDSWPNWGIKPNFARKDENESNHKHFSHDNSLSNRFEVRMFQICSRSDHHSKVTFSMQFTAALA